MISVSEALARVCERASPLDARQIPLHEAAGCVLEQPIVCTIDSPPFDKSQVDGFAVRCSDVAELGSSLQCVGDLAAGEVATEALQPGTAIRIMTGAPIPRDADAVIMLEKSETISGQAGDSRIRFREVPRPGQNILPRAASMRSGQTVLSPGHVLRAIEIGLLAELGIANVPVFPAPTVAILSTGNELVPCNQIPQDGQIRNSNGPMLEALVREAGGRPASGGIVRDNAVDLTTAIRSALSSDVVLLSGGVSAGVLDLVPPILRDLGVEEVFHKVSLKPGKPLWFGVHRTAERNQLVFGLPGNPVSSLVCFQLFVRPALALLAGRRDESTRTSIAKLTTPFTHRGDRPTYFPGRARHSDEQLLVEPLPWRGSADLRTLSNANVLIGFEPGTYDLKADSLVSIHWL